MTNEKAPHRARRLSGDKLAPVTGGYGGSKKWDAGYERDARADYAANGAGMTFDEFLRKKVSASQIACRGTDERDENCKALLDGLIAEFKANPGTKLDIVCPKGLLSYTGEQ